MEEPNPPENRNINTGGGNYNERMRDYIDNRQSNIFKRIIFSIFQWTNNIFIEQTLAPVGNPARAKNQRLLLADVIGVIFLRVIVLSPIRVSSPQKNLTIAVVYNTVKQKYWC